MGCVNFRNRTHSPRICAFSASFVVALTTGVNVCLLVDIRGISSDLLVRFGSYHLFFEVDKKLVVSLGECQKRIERWDIVLTVIRQRKTVLSNFYFLCILRYELYGNFRVKLGSTFDPKVAGFAWLLKKLRQLTVTWVWAQKPGIALLFVYDCILFCLQTVKILIGQLPIIVANWDAIGAEGSDFQEVEPTVFILQKVTDKFVQCAFNLGINVHLRKDFVDCVDRFYSIWVGVRHASHTIDILSELGLCLLRWRLQLELSEGGYRWLPH